MPSVTRTIHFEKTQERYELTASPACVHLDGGGNQTETVTVRLMHYKGKESEEITGKSVTVTDGESSANFTLPAEINQSGSTVISQSLDDREHGAPDSLTVIGILGANNLVIPVVHDGANGENAVTVQISPEAILHKKATTSSQYSLAIRVWNGKTAIPASGFSAKIQSKPNGLSEYTIASAADSYINYLGISISANTEIYGDITIAVTYNGNTYTKVVPFKTIVNGADGENAVTVQISPEAILHKKATTSSQYSLAIRVWNGKTAVPASGFSAKIQSKPNGLSEYTIASAADSYINYLGISISANTEIYGDITIAVTYNGNTYTKVVPFKTIVNGADGENAVTVQISPEAILHKKATTSSQYSLAIRVWNGKTAIPASGFSANIQSKASGLSEYAIPPITGSYYNYIGISIGANIEVNGDITIAVTYNGNTYTKVVPFKTIVNGDPGIKGEKGASLRGPQAWSDLSVGYQFYQGKNGEDYKDIVLYNGNYYSCIKTHQKNSSNYPTSTIDTDNGYWKLADKFELVATNLFLATYALIKNLGVEAIEMKDSGGNVLFYVKDGNVTCKTGTFENITIGSGCINYGINRQPFFDAREVSFSDSWLEPTLHDNVTYPLSVGRNSPAYLPWDEKANGRRIVIVNEYADGAGYTITAPTGKCFYEDGLKKTEISIANEAVFLVGYGTKYKSFSGWIVLSRVPLNRRYNQGAPRRVLYQGKCSNGGSLRYWTFDGSTLTSSRLGQGHYRITFEKFFTSVGDYEVILSSYGMYGHETTQQVYASLGAKTTSYFEVLMADDSSMNDANFLFEVIPATHWHS